MVVSCVPAKYFSQTFLKPMILEWIDKRIDPHISKTHKHRNPVEQAINVNPTTTTNKRKNYNLVQRPTQNENDWDN